MRKDVVGVVVAILVILLFFWWMSSAERTYNWSYSFAHDDDNPFGCQLFDKMASATIPSGYTYSEESPDEFFASQERRTLLLVGEYFNSTLQTVERLDSFVRKGNKLMLVCCNSYLQSDIGIPWARFSFEDNSPYYFSVDYLKACLQGIIVPDTFYWSNRCRVRVDVPLATNHLKVGKGFKPTCWMVVPNRMKRNSDQRMAPMVVSAKMKVGKGEVHLVSTPLLFTNYGVLDKQLTQFLHFQLAQVSDLPVVRMPIDKFYTRSNSEDEITDSSVLYVLLERPPLRWAIYTLLAVVLLFMAFTARRRQRRIPVVERPANRNLEFVRLLGTIYYRRHDHLDLLRKKYTYFAEELRRNLLLDIDDQENEDANIRLLAQKTGIDEEQVRATLTKVRDCVDNGNVSEKQLFDCIDQINKIIKRL